MRPLPCCAKTKGTILLDGLAGRGFEYRFVSHAAAILENFKRLHAEGAISAGIIVTRGSELQDSMREFVYRFTQQHRIDSFEALEALGLNPPTRRRRAAVADRMGRARNPLSFADAWTDHFVSDKFGAATTHWRKLMDRVSRGVGNPCPLLLIGLPASIVTFEVDAPLHAEDAPD